MRVLHVIEGMHQGGAESLILEHVRHAAPDVDTLVCALNRGGPALEEARSLGARTFVLAKGGNHLGGLGRLVGLMRAEGVQIAHGHNPTGALYATAAGRWAGVDAIVRTEHSIHYPGRHSALYGAVLEPALTLLDRRVICVCEAVRLSHVRRLPWARDRFVTILNGISSAPATQPRSSVRRDLGLDPADRVAITVGSLTRQKAQQVLIEAFADVARRLPGARLLIAGDGPLREPLVRQAAAAAPEGVIRFLGRRDDAPELMGAADVFVLSSVREGLSVTLLEAMRGGLPAVVTEIGGSGEAVSEGETGRVVPVSNPAALAGALFELLGDPARASLMGAAGRERWAREFTAERMVRETEALCREGLRSARWGRTRAGADPAGPVAKGDDRAAS